MIGEPTDITGFHAHVYFDEATRETAVRLREGLVPRFAVELGRWHAEPVGPHQKAMYQVAFGRDQFAAIVPWLMLNRSGLSILVHPLTDDPVADHAVNSCWLGEPLPLDVDFIRRHVKENRATRAASSRTSSIERLVPAPDTSGV